MDFKENQAIYLQIAELVCDYIVAGKWSEEERIPSVRELGMQLQVNPNTVMRAYEYLQTREIICNKRGIGFFVSLKATQRIVDTRRKEFIDKVLPDLCRQMRLLNIPLEVIRTEYEKLNKNGDS